MTCERWKSIVAYQAYYEVSNHGRVRSLDRVVKYPNASDRHMSGRILTHRLDNYGYPVVNLSVERDHKTFKIHRLVLTAFVGDPEDESVCMHLDNNPENNSLDNLRWGTSADNNRQCIEDGRGNRASGECHGRAKLTEKQVLEIRKLYFVGGITQRKLGMIFAVSRRSIGDIVNRKNWRHI